MYYLSFALTVVSALLQATLVTALPPLPTNAVDCTNDASVCKSSDFCGRSTFCLKGPFDVDGKTYCIEEQYSATSNWDPVTLIQTSSNLDQRYCGHPCAKMTNPNICLPRDAVVCTDDTDCTTKNTGWCGGTNQFCWPGGDINGQRYCFEQEKKDISKWPGDTVAQVTGELNQRYCGYSYNGRPAGECQTMPAFPDICLPENAVDCTDDESVCGNSKWCGGDSNFCRVSNDDYRFDGRSYCFEQQKSANSSWSKSTVAEIYNGADGAMNQRFCGFEKSDDESDDSDDDCVKNDSGFCLPLNAVECTDDPSVCKSTKWCGASSTTDNPGDSGFCYNTDLANVGVNGKAFCFERAPSGTYAKNEISQINSASGLEERYCGYEYDGCRTTPGNPDVCIPQGAIDCTDSDVCAATPECGKDAYCYNNDFSRTSWNSRFFCFQQGPTNSFKSDTIYQTADDGTEQRFCGDYSKMIYPGSAVVAHPEDILWCTFAVVFLFV